MQRSKAAYGILALLQSYPIPGDTWMTTELPHQLCTSRGGIEDRCSSQEASSTEPIDVTGIFVDIAFRSTPWAQEAAEQGSSDTTARILFVSESNVCRSVLAEAVMRQLLQDRGLSEEVTCESKGTRCAYLHLCAHL